MEHEGDQKEQKATTREEERCDQGHYQGAKQHSGPGRGMAGVIGRSLL